MNIVPKEYRSLATLATGAGWRIEPTRNSHLRWLSPDGASTVITSGTPGNNWTARREVAADLRRAGLREARS
jgi:hypothetical protein